MAMVNTTLRADRCRAIAADVRSASCAITFPDSRATMLRLAQAYDDEADRLERLSARAGQRCVARC
ncbi:MAG: hypothetical protein ACM30I_01230 [Gemmatimonas sp.]